MDDEEHVLAGLKSAKVLNEQLLKFLQGATLDSFVQCTTMFAAPCSRFIMFTGEGGLEVLVLEACTPRDGPS